VRLRESILADTMQESSENVMEIHDDDPDQFKFLLKYYYTYDYDEAAVDRMAGGKPERRLLIPIGIHALADKYDIQCICNAIADDLRKLITNIQHNSLRKLLDAHYATVAAADGPLGELLISHVLKGDRTFMHTTEYKQMLVSNPVFGAGMALALERNIMDIHCSSCFKHSIVRRDVHKPDRSGMTAISCSYCRAHVTSLREN
jgi:hypothetical protein